MLLNRVLFLPLSMLGLLLGVKFKTRLCATEAEREYQRYWPCGCRASYRDERDETAAWSPCDGHLGWAVEH
jgi:hypothetical protein